MDIRIMQVHTTTDGVMLAQIGDPHLTTLLGAHWTEFCNKRVLGYLSWRRRRRHLHHTTVLTALVDDLRSSNPDYLAVMGDLTHVGLPQEYREAAQWLAQLGSPEQVQAIPGNHEAYTSISWDQGLAHWAAYLRGDDTDADEVFPSLRVRRGLAIIGLNTAIPTPPFLASGRLGDRQLQALEKQLGWARDRGLFRLLLIHHPPVPGSEKWRKRLTDAEAFCSVIARQGAELILHGHGHRWQRESLPTPNGPVAVLGSPSASSRSRIATHTGAYALYRFTEASGRLSLERQTRVYDHDSGCFVAGTQETIAVPVMPVA